MLQKIVEEKKQDKLNDVDEELEVQTYHCEVNDHILERTRIEAVLIKEKVKEMQKVIQELEKKYKAAKILEVFAVHSRDEVLSEQMESSTKIKK